MHQGNFGRDHCQKMGVEQIAAGAKFTVAPLGFTVSSVGFTVSLGKAAV